MQKLQFEPETLQQMLGVGKIRYMSVAILEDSKQALRIDCEDDAGEYKTVRASKPAKPAQKSRQDNYKPVNKNLRFERDVPAPDTGFGAKAGKFGTNVAKGVVDWIRTPPRKKPEDW